MSLAVTGAGGGAYGTVFVRDTMTGADATLLTAHTGELGATWTIAPTSTQTMQLISNRVRGSASSALFYASGVPPTANYEISADVTVITNNASGAFGVMGRIDTAVDTKYTFRYTSSNNLWELSRSVNGVGFSFGTTGAFPLVSGTHRFTLRMAGDQISGIMDGAVVLGPVTDANITLAGRAGIYTAGAGGDAVGFHLDNYVATTI